eukprot:8591091-Pyramimonas_sp.AAC.1
MRRLGLLVQPVKSGYVGTTREALKKFSPWAKVLRPTQRKQMRNLGHDMVGGRVIRTVAKGRLDKMQKRMGRVKLLRKTAGSKVGAIWRT